MLASSLPNLGASIAMNRDMRIMLVYIGCETHRVLLSLLNKIGLTACLSNLNNLYLGHMYCIDKQSGDGDNKLNVQLEKNPGYP
jgi:hypothetical protein